MLAGAGKKVEATRAFARSMVQRHASRVEIWDEGHVASLAQGDLESARHLVQDLPLEDIGLGPTAPARANKYAALSAWLVQQRDPTIEATFREIEEVLGFQLPPSSRRHLAHWYGYKGSAVARAIKVAGWRARNVDVTGEQLVLERARGSGS